MLVQIITFINLISLLQGQDCQTQTNSCKQTPECIHFQFDILSLTCINCAALKSTGCTYTNKDICTTYVLDNQECIDCSLVEDNKCKYSGVTACKKYGYDGSSKCYNCETAYQSQCIYQRVTKCATYAYDKDKSKCFDCNSQTVWTDSMCLACNASSDKTIAKIDKSDCEDPSDRTKASSSMIQPYLLLFLINTVYLGI